MHKINRIKISGFRRLLAVDLPVRPFMVLIGANSVGKTSFLDALSILDRFIRFLNPDEVVVMDVDDDGCASTTWADSLDLDQWLAECSLDEVWRMGRMGGRS